MSGKAVSVATGLIVAGVGLFPIASTAHLYEKPAGAKYDFVYCRESAENPNLLGACQALGLLYCDDRVTGTAFLVRAAGDRQIVVSSAHAFIEKSTNALYGRCEFRLQGDEPGVPVETAVLLDREFYSLTNLQDLAAAQLAEPGVRPGSEIGLVSIDHDSLPGLVRDPSVQFSFLSLDPWEKAAIVSGYDCAPMPKAPGHLGFAIKTEFNHNCPTVKGYSGSPGMIHSTQAGTFMAFCVHSRKFGPKERRPFDPAVNPNTCAVITEAFIDLVNDLSRGRSVDLPARGIVVEYQDNSRD